MADDSPPDTNNNSQEEEEKAPDFSSLQSADEVLEAQMGKQITSVEELRDELEEKGEKLRQLENKARQDRISSLDTQIRTVTQERVFLFDLGTKIGRSELADANYARKIAKTSTSYRDLKNGWSIYQSNQTTFDADQDPKFWSLVSQIFIDEAVRRGSYVDQLQNEILLLRLTATKEALLSSQPSKADLEELERAIDEATFERNKVIKRMKDRQTFYNKYRERLLEHAENAAAGQQRKLNQSEKDEVDRRAAMAADQYLKTIEESEERPSEQGSYRAEAGRVIIPQTQSSPPERQQLSPGQISARRERYHGAGMGGWRNFFKNPFDSARDYLAKFRGGGTTAEAAKEAATKIATNQVANQAKTGLASKALGLVKGAGGWVGLAIGLAVQLLTDKEFRKKMIELLKNVLSGGAVYGFMLMVGFLTNFLVGASTLGGIVAGAMIGFSVGGPIGAIIGGFVGGIGGLAIGQVISSAFGAGTPIASGAALAPAIATSTAAATAGTIGGSTGITGAFAGSTIGSITTVSLGTAFAAIFATTVMNNAQTNAIFRQAPQEQQQGVPAIFEVVKTANPSSLPDYKGGSETITYTVTISAMDRDIQVASIDDTATDFNRTKNIENLKPVLQGSVPSEIKAGSSVNLTYRLAISGNDYNNSSLVNRVFVTAKNSATSESQTQTAEAKTTIGNPVDRQPYGFPKAGAIRTLDDEMIPDFFNLKTGKINPAHRHCGEIYKNSFTCVRGGLDIGGASSVEVKSTLEGTVSDSWFNQRLGGVVTIVSPTGQYFAVFMHLKDAGRPAKGGAIKRGDKIGEIYTDYVNNPIDTSSGAHLHYQVLKNGVNVNFGDAKNAGPCIDPNNPSAQPVEPTPPPTNPGSVSAGPFECQATSVQN